MLINPKYAEFSKPDVPLEEIEKFYSVPDKKDIEALNVARERKRPYSWSNSIITFDGVLHYLDDSQIR
jgi:predicted nucleic acid-binding protein